jgi:hypothetical protein
MLFLWLGVVVWALGPSLCMAQAESPFAIRVEAPEVVVPVVVLDRTHVRLATGDVYEEVDEEIFDLSVKDFRIFEDGVEQPIKNVSLELPRIRDVRDNISHHIEESFTPRGTWSSPDLWNESIGGPTLSPIATYLVSYVPPPSSRGSCHRIVVKVKRHHAAVRARDEYCNVKHPLSDPVGGTRLGQRMQEYAESSRDGEFPLSVQVGAVLGNSEVSRIDIAVEYPWNAIRRKWGRVNLYAMVAVLGMVRDKDGNLVARFSDMDSTAPWNFYRGPLPADRAFLKNWETAGIPTRYETQLELAPGEYSLQIVVTDGEHFGRVETPVHVESMSQDRFAGGDILLCKRFHEVLEGAQAAARAPKHVPLISNGMEFMPAGDLRFHKGERVIGYFEIYEPSVESTEPAHFRIRVSDAKTRENKIDSGLHEAGPEARLKNGVIPVAAEMATERLSPGAYEIEVQVSDATGKIISQHAKAFVVE